MKTTVLSLAIFIFATFSSYSQVSPRVDSAVNMLRDGRYSTALVILRPLAIRGDAGAQANLGTMYAKGHGVEEDAVEAVRLFRLSAEQGYYAGQFNLATSLAQGLGVEQNYSEAIMYFIQAAEQKDRRAMYSLAKMNAEGQGIPRNMERAYMWFSLAAQLGEEHSQRSVIFLEEHLSFLALTRARMLVEGCLASDYIGCQ